MTGGAECLYCIDGLMPTPWTFIGYAYRVCLYCQPTCGCCGGNGRFPGWTKDMARFIAFYNHLGYAPALCHTCGGVVDIAPLDEEKTHDHHQT